VLVSLSGSSQTAPAFWLNPANASSIRSPCRRRNTASTASTRSSTCRSRAAPAPAREPGATQLLGNLVEATAARQPAVVSRYNILPAIDVYVSVQGTDLASVAMRVQALVDEARAKLPRGSQIVLRGRCRQCSRRSSASASAWRWRSSSSTC
jgi:multidrug efflux pump subunit AcrB